MEVVVTPEGEATVEMVRERLPADEPVSFRGKHPSPGARPSAWDATEAHTSSRRAAEMHASDAAGMHAAAEAASATVESATTAAVETATTAALETATTATLETATTATPATVASPTAAASENSGRSSKANCSQCH
jgi:hypothetical protein